MKWVKTKYDLSLNEVSLMFEKEDISILKAKRYVPGWILTAGYAKFMLQFSEMFNAQEVNQLFEGDVMRLKIVNRFNNVLAGLYHGLMLTDDDRFKAIYKEMFHRDYNGLQDLKVIISEMERLKGKYKELLTPEKKVQEGGKLSFEQVITYVEMVLERAIDREMKLYQFKFQYDLSVKRAKEFEKARLKNA